MTELQSANPSPIFRATYFTEYFENFDFIKIKLGLIYLESFCEGNVYTIKLLHITTGFTGIEVV